MDPLREVLAARGMSLVATAFMEEVALATRPRSTMVVLVAAIVALWNAVVMRRAERKTWRLRREARERALQATFGGITLAELTHLADEIAAHDPELASRLDLEGLLDRHVELTLGHEQALRAAGMSDRRQLERLRESAKGHPRRIELAERRLRCLDECEARVKWYADELVIVGELIRLVAQRVACPEGPPRDDTVTHDLAELDDTDAIRGMIAHELHDH